MRKVFISAIDSLHYLLTGEQEEEIAFNNKLSIVAVWFAIIIFCVIMLNLFLRK